MKRQSTDLQDRLNLRQCRLDGQMFAHTVTVTDRNIRSHTGGDNLRRDQQWRSGISSKRRCAYQSNECEPFVWPHSPEHLSYTFGVDTYEKPD